MRVSNLCHAAHIPHVRWFTVATLFFLTYALFNIHHTPNATATPNTTTWPQQAKLTASNAANDAQFGAAIALSGSSALMGANQPDAGSGSAYLFQSISGTFTYLPCIVR